MKRLIITLISFCLFSHSFSQMHHLENKDDSKRNKYLVQKAKEVIIAFGPDYYRDYKEPIISDIIVFPETFENDPVLKDKKLFGRKYYTITFMYDPLAETLLYNYAAEVDIWADDGQPANVRFGCGRGKCFYSVSYKEWLKKGIKEEEIIPYIESEKIDLKDLIKTVNGKTVIHLD